MGQGDSKLHGSYTFGYILNHTKCYATKQNVCFNNDNILEHPELYGLRKQNKSPPPPPSFVVGTPESSTSTVFSDSYIGDSSLTTIASSNFFLLKQQQEKNYDESKQLIKDLVYIDQVYYPELANLRAACIASTTNSFEKETPISFADLLTTSPEKALREIYLSGRSLTSLSPNIGLLTMIRKLDLSNNHLTEIPESIGYMQNLEVLLVPKNRLTKLPDTIGYLSNLQELDAAYNQIQQITPCIGYLDKLRVLALEYNNITHLPPQIGGLTDLLALDLVMNPLRVLPAEVSQLPFLRRIRLDGCPVQYDLAYSLIHNTPSLVELCARAAIRNEIDIKDGQLPEHLEKYIQSASACTSCHGPYFESYILRGGIMKKSDMDIPIEYRLCSSHWSDNDDRVLSMFSSQPDTSSHVVQLPQRPKLTSCYPKQTNLSMLRRRSLHLPALPETNVTSDAATPEASTKITNQRKSAFINLTWRLKKSTTVR
ncbi:L domain-like protein [Backusella circina FSU 941]|nr:L domain-like protein [Backusella circina FSU 941]